MISIGAIYKGPELRGSSINLGIMKLARVLKETVRTMPVTKPEINVVFFVPGSLGKPDFDYIDYGKYSTSEETLIVQIPVPVRNAQGEDIETFLIDSLRGANAMAYEFFRQKNQVFDLRKAEAIVTSVAEALHG